MGKETQLTQLASVTVTPALTIKKKISNANKNNYKKTF